ncbi:MAG: exosome complex RNA-binding protein Rrp4 [Methanosarcinaceae archaeon]
MNKKIVIPGQFISNNVKNAGPGTYIDDGKVYSLLYGILNDRKTINVLPFSKKYIPSRNDLIIGTVIIVTPSNWIFEFGSAYDGLLHVSEFPRRVEQAQMKGIMNVGDSAIIRIKDVNTAMKVELTMRERGLRVIKYGRVIEIMPTKVPRLIGHSGSMITMLQKETNCEIFVGQNGRIWINGNDDEMDRLGEAIDIISRNSNVSGLTEMVFKFFRNINDGDDVQHISTEDADDTRTDDTEEKVPEDTSGIIDMLLDPEYE